MLALDDLKPYASFRLGAVRSGVMKTAIVDQVLDDIAAFVEESRPRNLAQREGNTQTGQLWVGFLIYTINRPPAWAATELLVDSVHHLVFVARRDRHVAIYASEPPMGRYVSAGMSGDDLAGLSGLERLPAPLMNTAFGRGAARTLWLSGIHRRTSSKADSKVLSGADLQDALDPLDDQTYYFTSARTQPGLPNLPPDRTYRSIGFTPRDSRAWAGSVREFAELRQLTYAVLGRLKDAEDEAEVQSPFVVLAAPAGAVSDLDGPYDIAVVAPELLSGDPMDDDDEQALAERWAYRAAFAVTPTQAGQMRVDVQVDGQDVGQLDLVLDVGAEGATSVVVTPLGASDDLHEATEVLRKPAWLSVRFESGHTLSDGVLYSIRHRDAPFNSWEFVDFSGFDVTKEKPPTSNAFDPATIGNHDSLFCWVKHHWPPEDPGRGWLACDDGSGEIADFVHFDPNNPNGPLLTLVHVKASGSDSQTRQISTSDYEVVVGQAVKNLRHLDRINLAGGLEQGAAKTVAVATWTDGIIGTRAAMAQALRAAGDDYRRMLVVVQPRVTRTELGLARDAIAGGQTLGRAGRLRQLDTLLLEAESSARDLSASFAIVSDQI